MTGAHNTEELDIKLRRLVMETRQGHKAGYRELLQTLAPFIRRSGAAVLARYGRPDLAEDITQEVLLAVHLKLHTYDAGRSFIAWVRAVMRYKIIDALRRSRTGSTVSLDSFEFWEAEDETNPEIQAVRHDLQNLLGRLKPPAGEIIYGLKVEGMSVQDLAAKHGMTESNIKVTVHRGLQKLSALIAEGEDSAR